MNLTDTNRNFSEIITHGFGNIFWEEVDSTTKGNCRYSSLMTFTNFEDALNNLINTSKAFLGLIVVYGVLGLLSIIQNFTNYYRPNRAAFYSLLLFILVDVPQSALKILLYVFEIGIHCYLCAGENSCLSPCNGRPDLLNFTSFLPTSDYFNLDQYLTNTVLLLYLSLTALAVNAFFMSLRGIWHQVGSKWFCLAVVSLPFIFYGLFPLLLWAIWYGIVPIAGFARNSLQSNIALAASIVSTICFPYSAILLFITFFRNRGDSKRTGLDEVEL